MIEAPARTIWRAATVSALASLTPRIRGITLDVPGWPGHRAGQHVTVRLTAPDGYQALRDYSIATADDGRPRLGLAVDLLPDGEVSTFLHEGLAPGDTLEIRGPLGGHFVWTPEDGGPVLLIGGGSGVVPLMAMLRTRGLKAPETRMALLLAARTWGDIAFRDELLARDAVRACVTFATSREPARRREDVSGRIGPEALSRALDCLGQPPRHAYICGATGFVETAAALALAAGIPAAAIRTERYGGA